MKTRITPALVAGAALILLLSYVFYARSLVNQLREHSRRSSVLYARVYSALSDTTAQPDDGLTLLLELSRQIMDMRVPTVISDSAGEPVACINLSFCDPLDVTEAKAAALRFDRDGDPVRVSGGQLVHFGFPPVVRALTVVPFVQAAALALVLVAGFVILRERARGQRERMWAGMARESAHQIATPLSSLNGWLELLAEREQQDEMTARALSHMTADVERLGRVAHRFERIGRPPRREVVDVAALATGVADYFRARVPTLAHRVTIECEAPPAETPALVDGDAVLLEWALEAIVKNAIDALAGREGRIRITVENVAEGSVRVRIADNGPGVNRDLRSLIFQPGFSTKEQGWGVGLALARRIVEENHGGSLSLLPSDAGAIFEIVLN